MALVGTISGSNGTSTTAISGSLIIADAPLASFPALQGGVKFLVSGSKNTTRTDNAEFLFNVDVFHSGAVGSDQYMQFKPVNTLQIPTNTTASYIYTSGSTNDLYFTQYSGPYTNTTRLRWLEGMLTTGLLHGGVLSTATGSTTFSITSGSGIILSYNATLTTDPYPTINFVQWPAYVSQSLTYVTSSLITYIGINSTGGIIQQTSPFTLTTDSDYITVGRVLHQSGSVTNGVSTQPNVSYGNNHWQDDFMRAFGPLKVSGHILAASGSTLGITKTAGDSYVIGRNYTNNPNNPNNITSANDTAVTVSKIYRAYVSGSTLRLDTGVNNAGYTTINPTQYNNNGTLASVGASEASIQRVYWYPNSASRAFTVYYGSDTYADPPGGTNALDVAQQNIASENFVEGENTAGAAILVGYILVLGNATNLSNTAQARFIQAGVSRGAGAGGGGGVAVGATAPGGLDTYVQFNDGGSTFGGDAGLTYNKTTDTLTIAGDLAVNGGDITTSTSTFNIVNSTATAVNIGGGASSVSIGAAGSSTTFAGNITGSNLYLSGDIAVVGGDITTTASTFNLVTGSATTVSFAGSASTALNIGNAAGTNTVLGQTKFSQGLSGSLTRLADGTSYLIAGTGVTLSTGSNGAVTFTYPAGSNVTGSFSSSTSWAFAHGMNSRFVVIQAYDTSYNQIIPQNITLVDNNNATITFPTAESGYAVASIGGVGSYAASSSYSLTASYVNPLVQNLQVTGSIASNAYTSGSVLFAGPNGVISQDNSSIYFDDTNNRLGLLTTTPQQTLHVKGKTELEAGGVTANLADQIIFAASTLPSQYLHKLQTSHDSTVANNNKITLEMWNGSANLPMFSISGSGNVQLAGNLAVGGGSITSTAGTVNIASTSNVTNIYGSNLLLGATGNVNFSGSAIIMNASSSGLSLQRDGSTFSTISGDATTISLGATPGRTTANIFNSTVSTLNIGGAATTINIGSGSGRTSVFNDLVLGTGNILVTNDATPITLISSGNIVAKLDINNNGTGHVFDIQDYTGSSQFRVGEDGNAWLSGSLNVTGSVTIIGGNLNSTAATFNILSSGVGTINIGSGTTTSSFSGDVTVAGKTSLAAVVERLVNSNSSTGVVPFDLTSQGIFYVNNPAADITTNFTNVPTTNNRIITPTVILSQSSTARIVSGCQIDGAWQTINWANGLTPTGTANKQDVFGFSLIRSGSAWKVLGQLSTYG